MRIGILGYTYDGTPEEIIAAGRNNDEIDFREFALEWLSLWRDTMRASANLTDAIYLDAKRTLNSGQPDNDVVHAGQIVAAWEEIEQQYSQAINLVDLAITDNEVELILLRRI